MIDTQQVTQTKNVATDWKQTNLESQSLSGLKRHRQDKIFKVRMFGAGRPCCASLRGGTRSRRARIFPACSALATRALEECVAASWIAMGALIKVPGLDSELVTFGT
jgi:hypothetical protein